MRNRVHEAAGRDGETADIASSARRRRQRVVVAFVGVATVMAAALVVSLVAAAGPASDTGPVDRAEGPERLVTCHGSHLWPVSALSRPVGAEHDDDPAAAALRQSIQDQFPLRLPASGWLRLVDTEDRVVFGSPQPVDWSPGYLSIVAFERREGAWRATGGGGCEPRTFVEGTNTVVFDLVDPEGLAPRSVRIPVRVHEVDCASGAAMGDRLEPPEIRYGDETVEVRYSAVAQPGSQTCPSNPSVEVVLVLDEPLGDRRLVDASIHPPRDATLPSDQLARLQAVRSQAG